MKRKTSLMALAICVLIAFEVACQKSSEQSAEQAESTTQQAGGKSHRLKHRGGTGGQPAAKAQTMTVPSGTEVRIRLTDGIDSGKTTQGSEFTGTLAEPLAVNGVEAAPVGSTVTGRVTHVISSGRLNRPAELSLALTSLTPTSGERTEISTNSLSMKGPSHKKRDIEIIGGSAGVGALIGAIAGKGKGAAIGSAVGAGAGTAGAAITGKKEIVLAPETTLGFTLSAPATLTKR